jgi:hypothetical protein
MPRHPELTASVSRFMNGQALPTAVRKRPSGAWEQDSRMMRGKGSALGAGAAVKPARRTR